MWGYETVIGCGMAMVSLFVSVLIYLIRLNTATTPQRDLAKPKRYPWPPLVRKW